MKERRPFSLVDYHCHAGENVLISYKGPIDKVVLNIMGNYIRKLISMHPGAKPKLFKVFIELAQNISQYSSEKIIIGDDEGPGIGSLVLLDEEKQYCFITGNLIDNKNIDEVVDRCQEINRLDKEDLRKLKREQLATSEEDREGADIGLIQLAITSENPLDIEVMPVDRKKSFITISVTLNK